MTLQLPAFIAFTGVDRAELKHAMVELSSRYPIEWGLLVDDSQTKQPLFPNAEVRQALLQRRAVAVGRSYLRPQARAIVNDPLHCHVNLAGFQRAQINHSVSGSDATQVTNASLFARRHGIRAVLQCSADFPDDARADWLFDTSFGTGTTPSTWPQLPTHGTFCGVSGGLNASNVRHVLEKVAAPLGAVYWIDMESGVRTAGWFDLAKCEAVCRAVYG